ncbi:hypothetical protein ACFVYA_29590 [Amycolatopsis sp. NPDC058278]
MGKSTLARLPAGIAAPSSVSVRIGGQEPRCQRDLDQFLKDMLSV